jgi:transformation/transcription domain-associated protein
MKILLADTKVENRTKGLELETLKLLRSVMGKWKTCSIEPVHFEKVVSMCMEEIASKGSTPHDSTTDKRGRERGRRSASSKSPTRPSKSTTSKNNSGARDEPKPVSSALLLACLEIFTVLLTCSPENVFLDENATVVKEILEACFLRARHRDGVDIRRQLKEFIVPLLKSGQVGQEGLQHVQVLVESFIIDESNFDQEISESAEKKDEKGTLEHGPFPSDDGKIGGSCIAFFSLDILREVAISDASAIRSFNSSLVAISGKLLSRHIHSVGSAQRQGGAGPSLGGRISSPHNQQSTPTSGILDEALAISNMPRDNIKAAYSDEKIDANITRLDCVTTIGTSIRCMITSLTLLSLSDLPYKFTRERHAFMKILGSIFDSSDNIQLLITASQIVGKWMVEDTGPLSRKEKITFLTKFASLDSRLVSPIMVQPLTELICHIIFSLEESGVIEYSERSVQSPTMMQSSDIDAQRSHYCFDTPRSVLKRCLMMCLMNANKSIRRKALSLYMRQIQERVPRESPVVEQVEQPKETQSLNAPMPNVIWELVHSDYEALSRRMWPVVFVDTLLFCCDQLSGVNPTSRKWIPCPNLPIIGNHTESIAQKKLSSFFDFVRNFSEDALRRQCLECIGSLAHSDQSLIQSLFESLMESAWRSLPNDYDRSLFIRPLERLLSHPYHEQQLGEAGGIRNSVQSLLRACSKLSPRPVLDPDLVVGLAGSYCTWHETISSLEHARKTIDHEEDPEFSRKLSSGIRHCMQQLGEKNVVLGLSMNSVHQQESTYVLSLDVYDMVKEAISGYAKLVELAESSIDGDFVAATDFELDVWEERWAHLQKEMCQSQVLSEYASVKDDTLLLLESSWKSKNWDKVASLVGSAPLIGLCEVGDPSLKMSEIMLAITRGKLAEVENLHAQTAQLCLQQWQTMPCIAVASQCHSKLLHFFHRLVEFRESGQIMVETMNHSSRRTLPDLQNLLR